MSSEESHVLEKLSLRRKITDELSFMRIPFYLEATQSSHRILKGMDEKYKSATTFLISKGCDRESLNVVLNLAAAMQLNDGNYSARRPRAVNGLSLRMRRLAKDIRSAELTQFMFLVDEQETGPDFDPFEDRTLTFPFLDIPRWLEKRAAMYKVWRHLASRNLSPKALKASQVARICVALYVKHATKRTWYPEVVKLLESVGLGNFGRHYKRTQLSRDVRKYETGCPKTCDWLEAQFEELDLERQRRTQHEPQTPRSSDHSVRSDEQVVGRAATDSAKSRVTQNKPKR
jgi:hypothetical protein